MSVARPLAHQPTSRPTDTPSPTSRRGPIRRWLATHGSRRASPWVRAADAAELQSLIRDALEPMGAARLSRSEVNMATTTKTPQAQARSCAPVTVANGLIRCPASRSSLRAGRHPAFLDPRLCVLHV